MPRARLFDKEEALKKAMEIFWEKGYASTSLQDLTQHLGIGKGSFYATFGSKEKLFTAALDLYKQTRKAQLTDLLKSETDLKLGLRKLVEHNLDELLQKHNGKGCFISNTSAEYTRFNTIFKEQFVEHFQFLRELLTSYLVDAKVTQEKAEPIVSSIITFIIGMSHQTKFDRNRERYLKTIEHIISQLD